MLITDAASPGQTVLSTLASLPRAPHLPTSLYEVSGDAGSKVIFLQSRWRGSAAALASLYLEVSVAAKFA